MEDDLEFWYIGQIANDGILFGFYIKKINIFLFINKKS